MKDILKNHLILIIYISIKIIIIILQIQRVMKNHQVVMGIHHQIVRQQWIKIRRLEEL